MAHNLSIQNAKAEMMYVGQMPWHGLGTQLDHPATAAEAIQAAHLDWEVEKQRIYLKAADGYAAVSDHYAVVRKDSAQVLGIVGKSYTPLQNRDAFGFFDPIVGEQAAVYHTAGVLGQGERVWILAKLPEPIRVVGDDVTDKFLLLANSHDGSTGVQVKFTPIRVVCQNTLTMALRGTGKLVTVAHTASLPERLKIAHRQLGIITHRYRDIEEAFRAMATTTLTQQRLEEYLTAVLPTPADEDDQAALVRIKEQRTTAARLFESGKGNDLAGVRGTLWAAYNAVAELVDYHAGYRSGESRLNSIWFGGGYLTKARAYQGALQKMKAWRN